MNSIVIIQARMGSSRLPGKSLMAIKQKPILGHIIDSVSKLIDLDKIVVATSTNNTDDTIQVYCNENGVNLFRGDENNVASRYFSILRENPLTDYFFRICGDAPFTDYRSMEISIKMAEQSGGKLDFITSMINKGYPQGMNIEYFRAKTFIDNYQFFKKTEHLEHVTRYFYENSEKFKFETLNCNIPGYFYEKYKFSVDSEEDFKKTVAIFNKMEMPHYKYTLEEKCKFYNTL